MRGVEAKRACALRGDDEPRRPWMAQRLECGDAIIANAIDRQGDYRTGVRPDEHRPAGAELGQAALYADIARIPKDARTDRPLSVFHSQMFCAGFYARIKPQA